MDCWDDYVMSDGKTLFYTPYVPLIHRGGLSSGEDVDVGIDKFGDEVRVGSTVLSAVGGDLRTYVVKSIRILYGTDRYIYTLDSYNDPKDFKKIVKRYSGDVFLLNEGKIMAAKLRGTKFY